MDSPPNLPTTLIPGADVHQLPTFEDFRGSLVVGEGVRGFPFTPARYFMVFDVPSRQSRGEHAHKECHQLLLCPSGSVQVKVENGTDTAEITLDHPGTALHIKPGIWASQFGYAEGTALLVFASHAYEEADYIRDYSDWLAWLK